MRRAMLDRSWGSPCGTVPADDADVGAEAATATTSGNRTLHIARTGPWLARDLDVRADIYSLGATLYHLV